MPLTEQNLTPIQREAWLKYKAIHDPLYGQFEKDIQTWRAEYETKRAAREEEYREAIAGPFAEFRKVMDGKED